ncbi:DegT/DnrJ/EryC1/StrS family aminotransferase [candidate division WOR-3 bacterium]|nr:DegT/DnrJ/EryC1/StrS family aminotransferase [candidate division WOR-3 bacterium]
MKVPLLDLTRQYKSIKEDINFNLNNVLYSQSFILGKEVDELERKIAEYCGTEYAIGVASGTDALLLSLRALEIGNGDFVVTTPFTFFSTAGVIHNVGATPVFIDIRKDTYNIDPERFQELLDGKSFHHQRFSIDNSRIKAIIPVHLYGQIASMDAIMDIAREYSIAVVEDAAQAIGSEYKRKRAGSIGNLGCFSFFPTKNLGGFGDGGMITTQDKTLEEKLRKLRVHGGGRGYYHSTIGFNSRLDTIQAAVLLAKLPHLDDWNNKRNKNAGSYSERLKNITGIETPTECDNRKHIYHQYTIRVKEGRRDNLQKFLKEKNIGTKVYYPLPLHLQKCFKHLGYKRGDFPVSEEAANMVLSLPIFPELTLDEIDYTCESIREFMSL